jgi:hypothetical protein
MNKMLIKKGTQMSLYLRISYNSAAVYFTEFSTTTTFFCTTHPFFLLWQQNKICLQYPGDNPMKELGL